MIPAALSACLKMKKKSPKQTADCHKYYSNRHNRQINKAINDIATDSRFQSLSYLKIFLYIGTIIN